MADLPEREPVTIRLSNLTQTDATPLLSLPCPPLPTFGVGGVLRTSALDADVEEALANDPVALQQTVELLRSTDLSYLQPRHGHLPLPLAAGGYSQHRLLAFDPEALTVKLSERPAKRQRVKPQLETPPRPQVPQSLRAFGLQGRSTGLEDQRVSPLPSPPSATPRIKQAKPPRQPLELPAKAVAEAAERINNSLSAFLDKADSLSRTAGGTAANGDAVEDQVSDEASDVDGRAVEAPEQHRSSVARAQRRTHSGHGGGSKGMGAVGDLLRVLRTEVVRAIDSSALAGASASLLAGLLPALGRFMLPGAMITLPYDEEEADSAAEPVLVALDACIVALQVASQPNMPQQALHEETLEAALDLLRFHLVHNLLPFHDVRLQRLHRPALAESGDLENEGTSEKKRPKSSKKPANGTPRAAPHAVGRVCGRLETALGLAAELAARVQLQGPQLIPLLRAAGNALTVASLPVLQVKASSLLVSVFEGYQSQREMIMMEIVPSVMAHSPTSGRRLLRVAPSTGSVAAGAGGEAPQLQLLSTLLLQMLQGCGELPAMDTEPGNLQYCCTLCRVWADRFWGALFDKFGSLSAVKADTDFDGKLWVERTLQDVLAVINQPEWPVAALLLNRFLVQLNGEAGLKSASGAVRQVCVDLLATVAAALVGDAAAADADAAWVAEATATKGAEASVLGSGLMGAALAAHVQLLEHLASGAVADEGTAASARAYLLARMLAEEAAALTAAGAAAEDLTEALAHHRRLQDQVRRAEGTELEPVDAMRLARAVTQEGQLGKGRLKLVRLILDAMDGTKQSALIRAKAVKALGAVLQASQKLLQVADVQEAVSMALQDEAVSVREAAVDLLGKHMCSDPQTALSYLDVMLEASRDAGVSVRKRAVRILWECCIQSQEFPRQTDACVAVLHRCNDAELSIQELVAKMFHGLWMRTDDVAGKPRSVADKARQLAAVAAAIYVSSGRGVIRLPLEADHPLVSVLRSALTRGEDGGRFEREAGRQLAAELLEAVLKLKEAGVSTPDMTFPYLLALHALAEADPSLCMPSKDPVLFVRFLASYVKQEPKGPKENQRRGAESLLCILAVLAAVLPKLGHLEKDLAAELSTDLMFSMRITPFLPVMSASCRAVVSLAALAPMAAARFAQMAMNIADKLAGPEAGQGTAHYLGVLISATTSDPDKERALAFTPRALYLLGQMCRYGADVIEQVVPQTGGQPLTMARCLRINLGFFHCDQGGLKVQDMALQSLGLLFIARPALMDSAAARELVATTLAPASPPAFKIRMLMNLEELLRVEEGRMKGAQQETKACKAEEDIRAAVRGKRKSTGSDGGTGGSIVIAAVNGEGDISHISSTIIQVAWDDVIRLATDTSAVGPPLTPGAGEAPDGAAVRSCALKLMSATLKGGLVAPWTAVPALVALTSEPAREAGEVALRLLKRQADKHAEFVCNYLGAGLLEMYHFQQRLGAAPHPTNRRLPRVSKVVDEAIVGLYTAIVQPSRPMRAAMLTALLKPFDSGSCLHSRGAAQADLGLLAFCAHALAALPMRRAEEPLTMLQRINSILERRCETVASDLKDAMNGGVEGMREAQAGVEGALVAKTGSTPAGAHSSAGGLAEINAAVSLCTLLLLKQYIVTVYLLPPDRIRAFATASVEKRKQEEKNSVSCSGTRMQLCLEVLFQEGGASPVAATKLAKVLKRLMRAEESEFAEGSRGVVPASTPPRAAQLEPEAVSPVAASTAKSTGGSKRRGVAKAVHKGAPRSRLRRKAAPRPDEEDEDHDDDGANEDANPRDPVRRLAPELTR